MASHQFPVKYPPTPCSYGWLNWDPHKAYTAGGGCTGSVCVGLYIVAKWSALIAERRKESVRVERVRGACPHGQRERYFE